MWATAFVSLLQWSQVFFGTTMPDLPVPLNQLEGHDTYFESTLDQSRPASLPVENSTLPFWLHPAAEVNPLAKEGSDGPLTDDADICIIGSGITGVSAAYHVSKSISPHGPIKAVILEARDFCSGATGRNGGHFTAARFGGFSRIAGAFGESEALKQLALEHHTHSDILGIIHQNALEDSVDLINGGRVELHFTEEEAEGARRDFQHAQAAGAKVDDITWISKADMMKTYGATYPGVQFPGHNLWPLKVVTELYRLAQNSSTTSLLLHTNTPVTSISRSSAGNRRWTLHTHRGVVSCSAVLHATNGYASHLLPHMAGPDGIIPTRGQVIATRASVSLDALTRTSWTGNEGFEYWFPRPVREGDAVREPLVILGGGREVTAPGFELYNTDDAGLNADASAVLRKFLPAVFPGKYEVGKEPEMEWSKTGVMGYTKLGDPFVGSVIDASSPDPHAFEGQYISAGYTGHGMPRAYACAEAVVQLILHELLGGTRDSWGPPLWLPRHYLTWVRSAMMEK